LSRWPLAIALLAALLLTAGVFAIVPLRSDMSELLPEGRTEAGRLMLRELRSGAATTVILAAIEGAPDDVLAAISDRMTETLGRDDRFAIVENGRHVTGEAEMAALFARRYLLCGRISRNCWKGCNPPPPRSCSTSACPTRPGPSRR